VKEVIASTIPDSLFLRVNGAKTAAEMWKKVTEEFEKKSKMVIVDLRRRLQDECCTKTGNVRTHLEKLQTLCTNDRVCTKTHMKTPVFISFGTY
jgi:hypothetical protein